MSFNAICENIIIAKISEFTVAIQVRSDHEANLIKVRKKAKIRNWYSQIPHLTQNIIWDSEKTHKKHHIQESEKVYPFQVGDHNTARNRQGSMTDNHRTLITKRIRLGTVSNILGSLKYRLVYQERPHAVYILTSRKNASSKNKREYLLDRSD